MVGTKLSHYKILDELGRGGMGIVYKAEDTKLDRVVAIKILPASALTSESDRARFYREAKAAAALTHPHIAIIHAVDEAVPEGASSEELRPFIAMEYIDGQTLEDLIEKGPLKIEDAVRITREVASALQLAHEKQIVHRDIKAANVMLTERGVAKVLDFGLAQTAQSTKLTRLGSTLGTVLYMSPEQARGEEVDGRTDIFSLGVVLYQMITGRMPFGAEYEQAIIYSIMNEDPEPITALRTGVPMELERIVDKCLAKDARRRYQHCDDLIADLEGVDVQSLKQSRTGRTTTTVQATPIATGSVPATGTGKKWLWPVITLTAATLASVITWSTGGGKHESGRVHVTTMSRVSIEPVIEMYPSLHPSGDRIVYAAGDPENKRMYYRLIDGGPPKRLVEGSETDEMYPSYSPDGNRVLFMSEGSVYTVEALGGVPRPVIRPGGEFEQYVFPAWSPSGDAVAFASFTDSVHVVDLESGRITFSAHVPRPHSVSWSPDGKLLAVGSNNYAHALYGNNMSPMTISVVEIATGERHEITSPEFMNLSPKWGAGSDAVFFISNQSGGQDVYRQPVSSSGEPVGLPERITSGMKLHSMDISKDGTRMVVSDLHYRQNVWAWPLDLDRVATARDGIQITTGDQVIEGIAFSPDGSRMAYDSDARGKSHIFVIPVTGGMPLQVTSREVPDFLFDWSPFSGELGFHTFVEGTRSPATVNVRDLKTDLLPAHGYHERYPFWLGDENTIAFHREIAPNNVQSLMLSRRDPDTGWGQPEVIIERLREGARYSSVREQIVYTLEQTIYIWDQKSAESKVLVHTDNGLPVYPVWSEDGNTVYFDFTRDDGRRSYEAISADGGAFRTVVDLTGSNKSRYFGRVSGDFIYSSLLEIESDIWVVDLASE